MYVQLPPGQATCGRSHSNSAVCFSPPFWSRTVISSDFTSQRHVRGRQLSFVLGIRDWVGDVTGRVAEEARRELAGEGKGQFFPRAVVSSFWLGETEGRGQREAQGPGRMSQVGNT